MNWEGWPLERVLVLFVGIAVAAVGVQVTLLHYRQNFHHKAMWSPVILAPIVFLAGILYAFNNTGWSRWSFIVLMWIEAISGLVGFYLHFKGVGKRVGGYELRNFLIGPPIVLPLLFTVFGILGLIATCWGEK